MQGDPKDPAGTIAAAQLKEKLLEFYDLEVDTDLIGLKGDAFSQSDLTPFLTELAVK